jgi:hypothetical protein
MSGDDQGSNDSAPGASTSGPAPGTEKPRVDVDRVHRGLASLIRQGVVRPNNGDYAPKDVQDEDDGGLGERSANR